MRMVRLFLRYVFVGALSLLPLILVLVVVNFLKDIGVAAFLKLSGYTDSVGITIALIFAVLLLFAVLGFSIERYGRSLFISVIDRSFERIPAIRTIYSVTKKLSNMLSGQDSNSKKEVVLVEYPKEGVWVPAYVLNRYNGLSVLFVPTSPNPTSGYTVIVSDSLVVSTSLTLEEASSFIISMGADFVKKEEVSGLIRERIL